MYGFRKIVFSLLFPHFFFFPLHFTVGLRTGIADIICDIPSFCGLSYVSSVKFLWNLFLKQLILLLLHWSLPLFRTRLDQITPVFLFFFVFLHACMCVHVLAHLVVRSSVISATWGCCSCYTAVAMWASPKVLCSSSVSWTCLKDHITSGTKCQKCQEGLNYSSHMWIKDPSPSSCSG